jgi:DNA invertase Pin-like site-specific DNA recombinase
MAKNIEAQATQAQATDAPKVEEAVKAPKVELYTPTETSKDLLGKYGNKSQAIRALHKQGMKTADIARNLNIRYQHVRNVLNQVVKTQKDEATKTA